MKTRIVLAAAGLLAPAAAANHVDFMVDGQFNISGPGSTIVSGDTANILGGLRFVGIDSVNAGDAVAEKLDGQDFMTFTNNNGAAGVLTLDYGDFAGGNGPLDADFSSQWSFLAVEIIDASGLGALSVSFESSAGSGFTAAQTVDSAGTYYFAFDAAGLGLVDFGDIDRVGVRLAAEAGADFTIGQITREVVPTPGSLAILGLGTLITIRRRR
jgi:hypothetical protein